MIANVLTDAALKHASSPKIFERGKTYASAGAVSILAEETEPRPAIYAEVAGTKTYITIVWIEDANAAGSCDCPNAGDGWFCKHQVAVALVWRSRLSGIELMVDEAARKKVQASAKRAQTVENRRKALQEFLRSQPAPVLAEKLIDLAESYHEIARELQGWQLTTNAQPEDLKPLVSEILAPGRQFVPLNQVPAYVRAAAAVLPVLQRERARDATRRGERREGDVPSTGCSATRARRVSVPWNACTWRSWNSRAMSMACCLCCARTCQNRIKFAP